MKKIFLLILILGVFSFLVPGVKAQKFYISGLAVSDYGVSDQWYLSKIRAQEAWLKTQGDNSVIVAVIDTGMDFNHPDLKDNIWKNTDEIPGNGFDDDNNGYIDDVSGWDFIDNDNSPSPNLNPGYSEIAIHHGTAVAGVIAAQGNNAFAGAGVAWNAKIMPLRAFNDKGESESFEVELAIQYAIDNGADIINMSFVGLGYAPSLEAKVKAAYEAGILLVAAAGNNSGSLDGVSLDEEKLYPVCHDGPTGENWVLGVAAVDDSDVRARFSNYGKTCIDMVAPGTNIYTTLFYNANNKDFNRYFGGKLNGTSMSVPQVVGTAVLVKALHPNYTNKELMQVLLSTTDNIDSSNPSYMGLLGKGRLNVQKAVEYKSISTENGTASKVKYVLAAKAGDEPTIWYLDSKGQILKEFYAFAPTFRGGVNLALGDIDNDGMIEVIAGAGYGGGPHVRIFDLSGELEYQFFAFDSSRRNGVLVGAGDFTGEGREHILAVEAGDVQPIAKVLNKDGSILLSGIKLFDKKIKSSINFAIGDVNKDGADDIVSAPPRGTIGKIAVIDGSGKNLGGFSPFGMYFYGGVNVAVGDLNNDGWAEIMASKQYGDAYIKTYSYSGKLLSPGLLAYDKYIYGVNIASGDKESDGEYEIIAAPNGKINTEIKIWDKNLNLKATLYPFGNNSQKAVNAYIVTR